MKRGVYLRRLYLAAGFVALLFAGIIYAWSMLKVVFIEAFGWSSSSLATTYTITISCFCLGCIASGFLLRRTGVRRLLLASAALSFCGFLIVSRLDGRHISCLHLGYGLLAGFGIGMAYNTILSVISKWFPDKRGLSSGVLMMGFGSSAMILGNIAAGLIALPAFGWRSTFLALASAIGAVLCAASAILRLPAPGELPGQEPASRPSSPSMPPAEMLKRPSFWKLFAAMTLLGAAGSSVISFAREFAISAGASVPLAGILVGILSICNGLGRILAGILDDRLGSGFTRVYICIVEILSCGMCILTVCSGWWFWCLPGFILVGVSFGSNTCAVSTLINTFYGPDYYAQNLSIALLTLLFSSLLAKLSSVLLAATGSYLVPFLLMAVYGVISLFLNLTNRNP